MKRACILTMGAVLTLMLQLSLPGQTAYAQDQSDQSKPAYTLAEYNAFQAARQEANPAEPPQAAGRFLREISEFDFDALRAPGVRRHLQPAEGLPQDHSVRRQAGGLGR